MLMSVYGKEKARYLDAAISSIMMQSIPPAEFVIVKDGPLTEELERVLNYYTAKYPQLFHIIGLAENVGLGRALAVGLEWCSYDIVARMDSDDIALPARLEKQLAVLESFPEVSLVGTYITEFNDDDSNTLIRSVPLSPEEVMRQGKRRNPFNHMTVVFRKDAVLSAGNYLPQLFSEDYYLWARMLVRGNKMMNIPEPLVRARAGKSMIARRGGLNYLKSEIKLQHKFYKIGYINIFELLSNVLIRSTVRLLPNFLREYIYCHCLRQKTRFLTTPFA